MATYKIEHKTTYRYKYPVALSHHSARLRPLDLGCQSCKSFSLSILPASTDLVERIDYFGNTIQTFSVEASHDSLEVISNSRVRVDQQPTALDSIHTPCGFLRETLANLKRVDLLDAKQYLFQTGLTPSIAEAAAFGGRFFKDDQPLGTALSDMLDAFAEEFTFDNRATDVTTPVSEVFASRRGVCQDFAHVMIASLRACGLSARYVSGYILTIPPEGEARLTGADASHAWVSVYTPEHGWIEVDPTNRQVCGDKHVRVAYGRDYSDVVMLSGAVTGGGSHEIAVEVTMLPV